MGLAVLRSRAAVGVEAPEVRIEVHLSGGMPGFSIVGLVQAAVRESKDRVRGALLNSGFEFPQRRITVSLAPADLPKAGGRFDLAIALGILAASNQLQARWLDNTECYGELSLSGELRAVPGMLPASLRAAQAGRRIVLPAENADEAALGRAAVIPAGSLLDVTAWLGGQRPIALHVASEIPAATADVPDLGDVQGQAQARRALEIAAAGGHNLLFCGPPGTGKSMLARRLPGVLPPMTYDEALETAAIESVLGVALDPASWRERPFRAPHHTASAAALIGGSSLPRPGEVSRAHNGVLFLDELPEWSRHVLETLREPMESGSVVVSRAARQAEFPASFQLVAAMNPCPCGFLGDPAADCHCSHDKVRGYRSRISAPILDRIDIKVVVGRPPPNILAGGGERPEGSAAVAQRVRAARTRQVERSGCCNARLPDADMTHCLPGKTGMKLIEDAARRYLLSIRAQRRILRVARSIADLRAEERVSDRHVAEAIALNNF